MLAISGQYSSIIHIHQANPQLYCYSLTINQFQGNSSCWFFFFLMQMFPIVVGEETDIKKWMADMIVRFNL